MDNNEHSTNLAEVGTDVPDINVGELISREQAIETFKDCAVNGVGIDGIVDALKQLPPANCSEFPNNSDTISREAVEDAINGIECTRHTTWYEFYQKVMTAVEKLPSAEPNRGKWIKLDMHRGIADHKCTACKQECYVPTCMGEPMYAFCPHCGAKMEVTT